MTSLLNSAKAYAALHRCLTPRFKRLDRLERYVVGTQSDGRPSFFSPQFPLWDRAPCVVYPIVASAIQSNGDLCLGNDKFPTFSTFVDEDDTAYDEQLGLSEDDSETLDRGLEIIAEQSRLQSVCRELMASAQSTGTAVAICSVRNGKLHIDPVKPQWCTPAFDLVCVNEVESLEIKYPYIQEYYDETARKWAVRCMLYRRVIDHVSDVTFVPVQADVDGFDPDKILWTRDNTKSLDHGLGFCPVVWYKHLPECSTVADIDGTAIHRHLLDEIDALNFALSQKHVASMVAASPPVIEVGVDETVDPSPPGHMSATAYVQQYRNADGALSAADHPDNLNWRSGAPQSMQPARKRGPGTIWRYPSADSKITQLTLPGDALKTIEEDCQDLRAKLCEALGVVFTDLNSQRSQLDVSGRALREQHRRQIERCDVLREDFGTNCILPLVDTLVRLILHTPIEQLRVPGAAKLVPILSRFIVPVQGEDELEEEWSPPNICLEWGEYFEPSEGDQKQVVDATIAALNAGLITKRSAVARVADFYNIGNVDEYMDSLEAESLEKQAKALENAQNMAKVQGPPVLPQSPKPNGFVKPVTQ